MGRTSRRRTAPTPMVAVVAAALLLAGCGGSLADADSPHRHVATARLPVTSAAPCSPGPGPPNRWPPCSTVAARFRAPSSTAPPRLSASPTVATAPGEIRADVERSVAAVDLQLDALEAAKGDTAAIARDAGLRDKLTSPEYTAAADRVRSYVREHCGITSRGPG